MKDALGDINEILKRVIRIEKEVEELKIMILKMIANNLPREKIDEKTSSRLKAELKNLKPDNISGLSVEEFIELLEKDED